jgi:tRNA splicing ligase
LDDGSPTYCGKQTYSSATIALYKETFNHYITLNLKMMEIEETDSLSFMSRMGIIKTRDERMIAADPMKLLSGLSAWPLKSISGPINAG